MFYANENSRNRIGSLLAGSDINCFDIIELPGFMPLYLLELPIYGEDGELVFHTPILVNNIDYIISLKNNYESPLEVVNVWGIFPGSMSHSNGWQTQNIKSVWKGTWTKKKEILTCTKLTFATCESILLPGNKPPANIKVEWKQVI